MSALCHEQTFVYRRCEERVDITAEKVVQVLGILGVYLRLWGVMQGQRRSRRQE
jgi:hypothetical protein